MDPTLLPFVKDWGPASVLTFIVLLIVMGRLIPRRTMNDRLADRDKIISMQEETITNLASALKTGKSATAAQIESAKTVEQMVRALPTVDTSEGET